MRISIGTTLWRTRPAGETDSPPRPTMVDWAGDIDHLLWQARYADEAGFEALWLTEHHFSPHGAAGVPSVVLAHLAAITSRLKLAYGIATVPMHHPVRLAEEMCWVDQLSKGRLVVGLGRGWTEIEFQAFQVERATERDAFVQGCQVILDTLAGKGVQGEGPLTFPYLEIPPGPFVAGRPPVHMVTTSEWSMQVAARFRAAPILGIDPAPELAKQLDRFREICGEEGLDEETITELCSRAKFTRRIILAPTVEEAREEGWRRTAEQDDAWYRYTRAVDDPSFWDPWVPQSGEDLRRNGFRSNTPGQDLDAYGYYGPPKGAVDYIRAEEEASGIHHMSTQVSSMGIDRGRAERQARMLAEEVLPYVGHFGGER